MRLFAGFGGEYFMKIERGTEPFFEATDGGIFKARDRERVRESFFVVRHNHVVDESNLMF